VERAGLLSKRQRSSCARFYFGIVSSGAGRFRSRVPFSAFGSRPYIFSISFSLIILLPKSTPASISLVSRNIHAGIKFCCAMNFLPVCCLTTELNGALANLTILCFDHHVVPVYIRNGSYTRCIRLKQSVLSAGASTNEGNSCQSCAICLALENVPVSLLVRDSSIGNLLLSKRSSVFKDPSVVSSA
jgi:hypothetical protein